MTNNKSRGKSSNALDKSINNAPNFPPSSKISFPPFFKNFN